MGSGITQIGSEDTWQAFHPRFHVAVEIPLRLLFPDYFYPIVRPADRLQYEAVLGTLYACKETLFDIQQVVKQ
ncbi:hypothetical protein CEXT_136241 [Caerostris extrusa]|uniref:Uncharacterized protein n=1 Tax=Caerostris extrusa TaxID=172846 RepID=A0AAV4VJP3_CAEEX|nr:hypothetical protein CEXT_136241 [Caerostris extrusa]